MDIRQTKEKRRFFIPLNVNGLRESGNYALTWGPWFARCEAFPSKKMKNQIKPNRLYWASFNRFECRVSGQAVLDIARSGPADAAVDFHLPGFLAQIKKDNFPNKPTKEAIRRELKEYGAWEADELLSGKDNLSRLLWIAACNIAEEEKPNYSKPCKAIAV